MASTLVSLGGALGMRVTAFITEMGRPLGEMAGNSLEVVESIDVLKGEGPDDTTQLVVRFAARMMLMADLADTREEAEASILAAVADGRGAEMFARMIERQGGDPRVVDDPGRLPRAGHKQVFAAGQDGHIASMDCEKIGHAVVELGGGRKRLEDRIDPGVGIAVHAKVGDRVVAGDPLATVHYNDSGRLLAAVALLERSYSFSDEPVEAPQLVKEML